jgi:hypothetical protein
MNFRNWHHEIDVVMAVSEIHPDPNFRCFFDVGFFVV